MTQEFKYFLTNYKRLCYFHLTQSWKNISFNQNEPEIIKEYLINSNLNMGIPYLNKNISEVLNINAKGRFEIKFCSVFTHQKPYVYPFPSFGLNHNGREQYCELGDLLVLVVLVDSKNSIKKINTKLYQAKKEQHSIVPSLIQDYLYSIASEFSYVRNKMYINSSINNNSQRLLPIPPNRDRALGYLIIEPHYYRNHVIGPITNSLNCWASEIFSMLLGYEGHVFQYPVKHNKGWDVTIDDLINIVGQTNLPNNNIPRGEGIQDLVNKYNSFQEFEKYSQTDEEGINKLIVFIRQDNLE